MLKNQIHASFARFILASAVRIPLQLRGSNPDLKDFPLDASMDQYRQQLQHESDFRRRRPADEGRRTKMRKEEGNTDNDNDSGGTNSNSTSSPLRKQPRPQGGIGGSRGRSPRPGVDPLTDDNLLYKTSVRGPSLPPRRSVNEKKVVNWRLACFMCNEYLTRGTLLGRPWPSQDSNPNCQENTDEGGSEKERLYHTLTDFLQAGDVHLPGIVNPSQLAAWLGLKQ